MKTFDIKERRRLVVFAWLVGTGLGTAAATGVTPALAFSEQMSGIVCQPAVPTRIHTYSDASAQFRNTDNTPNLSAVVCPIANHTGLQAEGGTGAARIKTIKVSGHDGSNNTSNGAVTVKVCSFYSYETTGGGCGSTKSSTNVPPASSWYNLSLTGTHLNQLSAGETPYLWIQLPKPDLDHAGETYSTVAGLYFDTI